jgi:peptidoglycan/xylan/chitin deacetylase (PgdA/CDA1 family)
MRDGVPRLLETFREFGVRATFFLAFGPDNSGRAVWQALRRPAFLKKMLRTGAPRLYGWRTMLSGTLLPSRPIATAFPSLVRRLSDEGHEVGLHGWDHRLWQDRLNGLSERQIGEQYANAADAYTEAVGRRPEASAAPGWLATATSLRVQDALGLAYASDFRGRTAGFPKVNGYRSKTFQVPTTQPCLEELLTLGRRDPAEWADTVLGSAPGTETVVVPLHAEVEGGPYLGFLKALLRRVRDAGPPVRTMGERAAELRARVRTPPVVPCAHRVPPGRAAPALVEV